MPVRSDHKWGYCCRAQAGVMDAFNEIDNFKKFVGYYRLIQTPARASHLDLNCALYVLYGVKYIDLVSLGAK